MRAIMTGAARGIGAATAAKMRARGWHVTALDVAEPDAVDRWVRVDLRDPAAIRAAVADLGGPYDCLINNAGLPPRPGLQRDILAVNFCAVVQVTEVLLPRLSEGAAIVVNASRAGAHWRAHLEQVKALLPLRAEDLTGFVVDQGLDPVRAYDLSKEAAIVWVLAQTERLAARGLRINSVSPAAVSTGILDDFATAFGDRMARNVARAGRPGTAEEIADVIVFLAGRESGWIKGVDITVDGGMSAMRTADDLGLPG